MTMTKSVSSPSIMASSSCLLVAHKTTGRGNISCNVSKSCCVFTLRVCSWTLSIGETEKIGWNIWLQDNTVTSFGLHLIHSGFTSRSKTKQPPFNGVSCPLSIRLGKEDIGKYVTGGDTAIMPRELQLIDDNSLECKKAQCKGDPLYNRNRRQQQQQQQKKRKHGVTKWRWLFLVNKEKKC